MPNERMHAASVTARLYTREHPSMTGNTTDNDANTSTRISLEDYQREILSDLPQLIEQHPDGIYIADLVEWYGESVNRTIKACQNLSRENRLQLLQAASKAYYVLPNAYQPKEALLELTPLQRQLVMYVARLASRSTINQVKTNYSQLARVLNSSYGGLRACVNRLVALGYLEMHHPSERGKQDQMLLSVNRQKLAQALAQAYIAQGGTAIQPPTSTPPGDHHFDS